MPPRDTGPKTEKQNVHFRLTRAMLAELRQESERTGHNRTTLLRIAWQEYMARRAAEPAKPRR